MGISIYAPAPPLTSNHRYSLAYNVFKWKSIKILQFFLSQLNKKWSERLQVDGERMNDTLAELIWLRWPPRRGIISDCYRLSASRYENPLVHNSYFRLLFISTATAATTSIGWRKKRSSLLCVLKINHCISNGLNSETFIVFISFIRKHMGMRWMDRYPLTIRNGCSCSYTNACLSFRVYSFCCSCDCWRSVRWGNRNMRFALIRFHWYLFIYWSRIRNRPKFHFLLKF